jgi:hypothetical protein
LSHSRAELAQVAQWHCAEKQTPVGPPKAGVVVLLSLKPTGPLPCPPAPLLGRRRSNGPKWAVAPPRAMRGPPEWLPARGCSVPSCCLSHPPGWRVTFSVTMSARCLRKAAPGCPAPVTWSPATFEGVTLIGTRCRPLLARAWRTGRKTCPPPREQSSGCHGSKWSLAQPQGQEWATRSGKWPGRFQRQQHVSCRS